MREIKFRAWENGKMYHQVRCGGNFDRIPTAPTVWNEDSGWANLTGQPYTKVMQYTGLKDKVGVEIYEGDIIVQDDDSPYCEVIFEDGCFVIKQFTKNNISWYLYTEAELIEVIGNIYEDEELLK